MTGDSLEELVPHLSHSHAERWTPAVGLHSDLKGLAQDVLPILKRIKRLVIGLAALAMDEPSRGLVPIVARELSSLAHQHVQSINEHQNTPIEALIARPIVAALHQMEIWAQVAATHGLSAEAASGLRVAYRSLRNSCQVLWPSELIPEGRDIVSEVSHG